MPRYDCVILYNAPTVTETEGSQELLYPSNVVREEVGAIEDSLRSGGFNPCTLPVEHFSKDLVSTLCRLSPKFVFNLCEEMHGRCDLEMCVAGVLELLGIPYTGSGPLALGLALDKFRLKQLLRSAGIPTAKAHLQGRGERCQNGRLKYPLIVKPAHEDASLGINSSSVCHDPVQLERQVQYIHEVYEQEALVEEYIDGREFNVGVLGQRPAVALPVSEIDFSTMPEGEPKIVSYRAKWDEDSPMFNCTVPVCPADLPKKVEERIQAVAVASYRASGCRDYARVDMRMDSRGRVYVLEVNPNPDISPRAGLARAARVAGIPYEELVLRISQSAIDRGAGVSAEVYAY